MALGIMIHNHYRKVNSGEVSKLEVRYQTPTGVSGSIDPAEPGEDFKQERVEGDTVELVVFENHDSAGARRGAKPFGCISASPPGGYKWIPRDNKRSFNISFSGEYDPDSKIVKIKTNGSGSGIRSTPTDVNVTIGPH